MQKWAFGNLEIYELLPFQYSSTLCQAYFENFGGICVTLKIASPSWCSNGALGVEPCLDFSPQS